jgi:hypothetical protein
VFAAGDGGSTTLTFRSPKTQCSTPAVDNIRVISLDSAVEANPVGTPVSGRDAGQ